MRKVGLFGKVAKKIASDITLTVNSGDAAR